MLLKEIFSKKYTNPSSEIISILAGLDTVDAVFADFVSCLDNHMRSNSNGQMTFFSVLSTAHGYRYQIQSCEGCALHRLWGLSYGAAVLFHLPRLLSISYEGGLKNFTSDTIHF